MKKKIRVKIIVSLVLTIVSMNSILLANSGKVSAKDFYFTLNTFTYWFYHNNIDYLNLMKQQLERIGINLEIDVKDMPWHPKGEFPEYWDFNDFLLGTLSHNNFLPILPEMYQENSSFIFLGYHTSMDWDKDLGTGKNQWFIDHGNEIMPPNSEERIEHYWEWQDYMMDELLLVQPFFSINNYIRYWNTLTGFNASKGIFQSWGKMNWTGSHEGQTNTSEIVVTDSAWSDLNPLFQDGDASKFISDATLDPLFWVDADKSIKPHLAENLEIINNTHIRFHLREGIKWATDPDGLFTNEYFDAEDVYFTLYAWKYMSNLQREYYWLENLEIIDKYTIDLFIDGDPDTPENEPYSSFLESIYLRILPEHYLNQTQDVGDYPDVTHASWNTFATKCFGTGLFEIDTFKEGVQTVLSVRDDYWGLNTTITSDPSLDWINRFGDFSGGLDELRIRIIPDILTARLELEAGKVDISRISYTPIQADIDFSTQTTTPNYMKVMLYNVHSQSWREPIGSLEPCTNDPSITKGLALRKAISYAIDRVEINNVVHGGDYIVTDYPIYEALEIWCNPNIIRYDHDLEKAKYYMELAGYTEEVIVGFEIGDLFYLSFTILITIIFSRRKKEYR